MHFWWTSKWDVNACSTLSYCDTGSMLQGRSASILAGPFIRHLATRLMPRVKSSPSSSWTRIWSWLSRSITTKGWTMTGQPVFCTSHISIRMFHHTASLQKLVLHVCNAPICSQHESQWGTYVWCIWLAAQLQYAFSSVCSTHVALWLDVYVLGECHFAWAMPLVILQMVALSETRQCLWLAFESNSLVSGHAVKPTTLIWFSSLPSDHYSAPVPCMLQPGFTSRAHVVDLLTSCLLWPCTAGVWLM